MFSRNHTQTFQFLPPKPPVLATTSSAAATEVAPPAELPTSPRDASSLAQRESDATAGEQDESKNDDESLKGHTAVLSETSRKREARGVVVTYLSVWLMLELVITTFLVTFLCVPDFALLTFSTSCSPINPATGAVQTTWYLQLFTGFSSQPNFCQTGKSGTVCIPWTNTDAWSRFESVSGFYQTSYPDTKSALDSAQALVPVGLFFILCATCIHATVLFTAKLSLGPSVWSFHIASWLLLLSWILLIVAQSTILYAPPMIPGLWLSFFRRGYSIGDLVSPLPLATPSAAQVAANTFCAVSFVYDGGVWLSISLGLLFFLTFFSVIAGCCIYPILLQATESPSFSRPRSHSHPLSHPHSRSPVEST